ncbi:MAG: B12-binding domain-containing radical SAM protein [Lachnospiraceae bacterium]|nr:B12-binding domain-containing radical SAM protein [Lachnospiraceae bacterium]
MKIVFIKVNMMYSKGKDALKPLIFPIIEKLTPDDCDIIFYDERIESLPDDIDADVIAFSVETFAARHAYELAEKYRKPGTVIAMGGFHASAMPDEVLEHADTVLIGDAEDTWGAFLSDVKNGCVRDRYESGNRCPIPCVDNNAHCFEGKRYLKLGMVQASRGCKFNCDFCSIKSLYPAGVRQKDIDDVIREIKNSRERIIFFIDDNLFVNKETASKLFKELRPLKKRWACQISMDIAFDDELLTLMHDSGCIMVLIGFESIDEKNLELMRKSANLKVMHDGIGGTKEHEENESGEPGLNLRHYEQAIANIYEHGIMIYGMFVLGYEHDTASSIRKTYEFAMRNNLAVANFNPLMILPGTSLYERMKEEGGMRFEKWWLDSGYRYGDAMFYPRMMTCDELTQGCKKARYDFNSPANIFRRMFGVKVNHHGIFNSVVFLLINFISRSEIHRKQGEKLGSTT